MSNDDKQTDEQRAFDALQLEGSAEIQRMLAVLDQYEPLVDRVVGLRRRFVDDGFPPEMAASMATVTYLAGLAPLLPALLGGTK